MKWLRLVIPAFAALVMSACSAPTPKCLPSNCSGCCDATGACVAVPTAMACGTKASTCMVCGLGQQCLAGFCTGGSTGGGTGGGATGGGTANDAGISFSLPDGGTPGTVNGTFASCSGLPACSGNFLGTWFLTQYCLAQQNPFGALCTTGSIISYTGTGAQRLDITSTTYTTTGYGTDTLVANFPQSCLVTPITSCTQLQTSTITCPVASGGRTGCDCTAISSSSTPTSTTFSYTVTGVGQISVTNNGQTTQYSACVTPGSPDVLHLTDSAGNTRTYVRR